MAYKIIANECTACGACEFECPNAAVHEDVGTGMFKIDAGLCTECEGVHDKPACVESCPVEGCIVQIAA